MTVTLATFNVNNLFIRYRFGGTFPGDMSGRSAVTDPTQGYLPMYDSDLFELFNPEQRALAAAAITGGGADDPPDVLCLQEVESLMALRAFNENLLGSAYPYAVLLDSRDFRQIDVAVLSRRPILAVRTHMDDRDPRPDDPKRPWLFSRDCLEVVVALNRTGTERLTVFVNHLKSKFVDGRAARTPEAKKRARARSDGHRERQSTAVARIVAAQFPGRAYDDELFAVVGDLNDEPGTPALKPLVDSGLTDALEWIPNPADRWTHWWRAKNRVSQIDYLLLSPALAAATRDRPPRIERRGVSFTRQLADGGVGPKRTRFHRVEDDPAPVDVDFRFPRFGGVSALTYASDHCPVILTV